MSIFSRRPNQRYRVPLRAVAPVVDPWMDKTIEINDKPTTLRHVRRFAVDMAEKDYRNPAEAGMAMTIVFLVDQVSWLNAQLLDKKQEDQ